MKIPKFFKRSEEEKPEETPVEENEVLTESPSGEEEQPAVEVPAAEMTPEEPESETEAEEAAVEVLEEAVVEISEESVAEELAELAEEAEPEEVAAPVEVVEDTALTTIEEAEEVFEEVGPPESEAPAGELPEAEEIPVPEPPKPFWLKRFIKWLFNKETKFGRFMRRLSLMVAVFGLGLLFAYIFFVRPQVNRVSALTADRQEAVALLEASEDQLEESEEILSNTNSLLAEVQADLDISNARNHLSRMAFFAAKAQVAIADKQGADAIENLSAAITELEAVQDYIALEDPDVAVELEARLTAAKSALVRDSTQANADLETIITLLVQQDKILTGK